MVPEQKLWGSKEAKKQWGRKVLQGSVENIMERIWLLWMKIVLEMSGNQKLKWSWSQMRLLAILSEDKLEGI